jgi:hypothetical protein
MAKSDARRPREDVQPLNAEQKRIITWLRKVRFKKQLFGGVSEKDVWKKIEELNSMYNLALVAERARYDALLQNAVPSAPPTGDGVDTTITYRKESVAR